MPTGGVGRAADDFEGHCPRQAEAETMLAFPRQWATVAGLTLHPAQTRIVNARSEGFDFPGWTFRNGQQWTRKKSPPKLQAKRRPLTRRTNGCCLPAILAKLNPSHPYPYRGFGGRAAGCCPTRQAGRPMPLGIQIRNSVKGFL
jgi:hypothetical protein